MTDLKLKRITGRNWMKIKRFNLDFPESGLVLVQGINTASGGALASVGSGKTSLGEAVCRTLLGISGRFASAKEYSLDKAGDMYVKLEADFKGKPLIVETGYRCRELSPTGDALRYAYDGKEVQRGLIKQTREDLAKLIGVPPLLAQWTVFVDGENLKFNKLSQSDCVDLVMSALRQPPWNAYFETSKTKLGQFRRDMSHNIGDHEQALAQVKWGQETVNEAEKQVAVSQREYEEARVGHDRRIGDLKKQIEAKQEKIARAHERMKEIKRKLKQMEDERAEASHKLEIRIHEAEDIIADKKKALEPLDSKRDSLHESVAQARVNYENYKRAAEKCPTCQRPMGEIDPERLALLRTAYVDAKSDYDGINAKFNDAKEIIENLNDKRQKLSEEHRKMSAKSEVESLSEDYENLEDSVNKANSYIQDIQARLNEEGGGPSETALVEAKTILRSNKEYLAKAKTKLETVAALLVEDRDMEKVMAYWNKAFSPYGIPNMVLREAINPLNQEARRISAAMTGGTIEVRFSTVRELASGQDKAQLNIEVDNKLGDKQLAGSSKGEAGLANFIISETLSEVGQVSRRVGFLWLDEILPHQDNTVCQSFYRYLKEKASNLGILIFLVDHNPIADNYSDKVLVVEKTGGAAACESRIKWQA